VIDRNKVGVISDKCTVRKVLLNFKSFVRSKNRKKNLSKRSSETQTPHKHTCRCIHTSIAHAYTNTHIYRHATFTSIPNLHQYTHPFTPIYTHTTYLFVVEASHSA
jgi:hypothetical protein